MASTCLARPDLRVAARCLQYGAVLAYPTEAVWGLGADPFNHVAVQHLLRLKQRPQSKGLILVGASMDQFGALVADLSDAQKAQLRLSWPGPNTWLVPHQGLIPPWICGDHDTVALRVSAHPVVQALCRWVGGPIVSTSANPQGLVPARYGYRVRRYFGDAVYYCSGQVDLTARPSVIRDLRSGQVLRS